MKLRLKGNSLRLRVNRAEVAALAARRPLEECIVFPGDSSLRYILEGHGGQASASFISGVVRVSVPAAEISAWADTDQIGIYLNLQAAGSVLKVLIEKDLECLDEPAEERDPLAFPRPSTKSC